ncbi:hypothetical protein CDD80_4917 [Ophiocordyceps camponoti-rufipedis]|uniref:Uncharacterized protein n=1 Tax=Ophiocordyceps camponoti-rufipedis TaxID=2004952 RepID=A0A2C5XGT6_9HYPO|nr:hypothetical protein CDD80_4917 [Ophiocordyceps camponoti-rufipedis]
MFFCLRRAESTRQVDERRVTPATTISRTHQESSALSVPRGALIGMTVDMIPANFAISPVGAITSPIFIPPSPPPPVPCSRPPSTTHTNQITNLDSNVPSAKLPPSGRNVFPANPPAQERVE